MFRLESLHIFIFVSFFLLSFLHHNRLVNHVASCHTKRGYVFGLLHHYFFVRISSEKHVYKLLGRRADKAACGPAGRGVFHPAAGAVNSSSSVWGGAGGTRTPHACPSTCSPAASERDAHGGREQSSTLRSRENTREHARTRENSLSRPDGHVLHGCWFIWRSSVTANCLLGIFHWQLLIIEKQTFMKRRK